MDLKGQNRKGGSFRISCIFCILNDLGELFILYVGHDSVKKGTHIYPDGTIHFKDRPIIKDKEFDSLKMLIAGIIVISAGFFLVGITLNPLIFLSGIIILSFGEMISYPAFLSYVSKIPPVDKRSIYMGYSFIPLAIAGVTAPIIGGFLYYIIGESMAMGRLFWSIIASIGLVSTSAFLFYDNHYYKPKKIRKITTITPILLIPLILVFTYSLGPDPIYRGILAEDDIEDLLLDIENVSFFNKTYSFNQKLNEKKLATFDLSVEDSQIEQILHVK